MAIRQAGRHRERGFEIVELIIVVAIILVVSAMAMPRILTAVENVRLRSAANGAAGVIQALRMEAVKHNTYYSAGWKTVGSGSSQYQIMYADVNPADGAYNVGEPMVQLPNTMRFEFSGANPAFNASTLLGTTSNPPQPASLLPLFNARGLPCVVSGLQCTTISGGSLVYFVYFLRLDGSSATRWAAVSVTPAGRTRVWTWDGSAWE
jgi:Tfp pilus assembly protein FimT